MARPTRRRRVCSLPEFLGFKPEGGFCGERILLSVDEYEVIRLIDLEKLTQKQCAERMDISRTTAAEVYEAAREKLADCIVNGRPLVIEGGNYKLCDGSAKGFCGKMCGKCGNVWEKLKKGDGFMRIAAAYENGSVYGHFGHTEQFKLYDVSNGSVVKAEVVPTNGSGHGALAGFLKAVSADVLICGGIGQGAINALNEEGIELCCGVSGDADEAVRLYLAGKLETAAEATCDHHEHESGHTCSEQNCGSHTCGEQNCGGH